MILSPSPEGLSPSPGSLSPSPGSLSPSPGSLSPSFGSLSPHPWQLPSIEAAAQALSQGRSFLNASDTGTGKTLTALWAAKKAGLPVRVVCPKSVVRSWHEAAEALQVPLIWAQNVEKLRRNPKILRPFGRSFCWVPGPPCLTVFDEVHRFGSYESQSAEILSRCPRPALMLSATAADSPVKMRAIAQHLGLCTWDLWPQWAGARGVRIGDSGGYEFAGSKEIVGQLHREIFGAGLGARIRIADLGDAFPENFLETVPVDVENAKAINAAYEEEIQKLKDEAQSPAVEMLRARQLAEHGKIPALFEMIADEIATGRSVVAFVNFRETLACLVEKFSCPAIYGQQSEDERKIFVKRFQEGEAKLIGVMIQAGGCGLDGLQDLRGDAPRTSLIFPGWSAVELRQAVGRIHRANSKSACLQKFIFASGTIEDRVRRKLRAKLDRIDLLNNGAVLENLTDSDLSLRE